ncbi:hypothetical protein GCM10010412_036220 [Nonomuraea recticatena]|uniref:Secreted protein n=1 Tax=Nonomuraea recticatena TaxID=46178 RepID=A0ABP6EA53_9ACTN
MTRPAAVTLSSLALSRSVTSASPPSVKAIAHGTDNPSVTVRGPPGVVAGRAVPTGFAPPPTSTGAAAHPTVTTTVIMITSQTLMCPILTLCP